MRGFILGVFMLLLFTVVGGSGFSIAQEIPPDKIDYVGLSEKTSNSIFLSTHDVGLQRYTKLSDQVPVISVGVVSYVDENSALANLSVRQTDYGGQVSYVNISKYNKTLDSSSSLIFEQPYLVGRFYPQRE